MTYTYALLAIPRVVWDHIAEAFSEAGYDGHHITTDADGRPTVAIDMQNIAVIPEGDSDLCINSGRLSDLMVQSNEEAFRAGYEAAGGKGSYYEAWGNYTPSDNIMDLQQSL